jgi:hypothetical protein
MSWRVVAIICCKGGLRLCPRLSRRAKLRPEVNTGVLRRGDFSTMELRNVVAAARETQTKTGFPRLWLMRMPDDVAIVKHGTRFAGQVV